MQDTLRPVTYSTRLSLLLVRLLREVIDPVLVGDAAALSEPEANQRRAGVARSGVGHLLARSTDVGRSDVEATGPAVKETGDLIGQDVGECPHAGTPPLIGSERLQWDPVDQLACGEFPGGLQSDFVGKLGRVVSGVTAWSLLAHSELVEGMVANRMPEPESELPGAPVEAQQGRMEVGEHHCSAVAGRFHR